MMIEKAFILGVLCVTSACIFAQDITGKWYASYGQHGALEITISEENNHFSGKYSSFRKNAYNTINAPIDSISWSGDSLTMVVLEGTDIISYHLRLESQARVLRGISYLGSRPNFTVDFVREPTKRQSGIRKQTEKKATRQDSIRGMITPERVWWDLTYYHLSVEVEPEKKYISGSNIIQYRVVENNSIMQIDLQPPLILTKAVQNGEVLMVRHEGNAHYIQLEAPQEVDSLYAVEVFFEGNPLEAANAPWDGGFSWKKDGNGNHFIATSCQGIGASIWWPCKDHMYDEVDSMLISVTNPRGLTNISNGRLRNLEHKEHTVTSHWFVNNPINNYGVNINIGDYVHFSEIYQGEQGALDLDYFVLRDNLSKAKIHFADAPRSMEAFEHWFGPYPFYEDGYKLVEVPYLGMEHQSSVTYGNQYKKGYLGKDLSGTGWGLKFDFIIVHESGHEWFANNITYQDVADMWVHESFINYSESLFLDYHYGSDAASAYVVGTRKGILNDRPIVGKYNINRRGSGDMYPKGGNMLHTLRQVIDNDEKWRNILRGLNKEFFHQTVTGQQVEEYINNMTSVNLRPFFDQYLRTTQIPIIEFYSENQKLVYRWSNTVDDFDMPLKISVNKKEAWIYPKHNWTHQYFEEPLEKVRIDQNFYVGTLRHSASTLAKD